MVHLNGRIEVTVIEARGLPNLDKSMFNKKDKSDPYCVVSAEGINGSRRLGKTHTMDDDLNPRWNYKLEANLNQDVTGLTFVVKDEDKLGSKVMGSCFLDSLSFASGGIIYKGLMHISSPKGRPAGSLMVKVSFSGSGGTVGGHSSISEKMKIKSEDLKTRLNYSSSVTSAHGDPSAVFFHGLLDIYIEKAVNLPNLDKSLLSFKSSDVSDPYVMVMVEDSKKNKWKVATTSVRDNNLNPVWKERFFVNICHEIVALKFIVKDKDVVSADEIGRVTIKGEDLHSSTTMNGDFELYKKGKPKKDCNITLFIQYKSTKELSSSPEVPECLYPLRDFNKVTLYQDAHCMKLPIPLANRSGKFYSHSRTWLDVYNTLMNAQAFIYIVGWSVNTQISLLRWAGEDTRNLGDILKQKSQEGVIVCIMVWDELTSTDFNKDGAMGTSDQETAEFFKGTDVTVILASRERKSKDMVSTKKRFTNFCYTHHQKCIIADAEVPGTYGKRQNVAYVGGLDLTQGRFDTPDHPLFETLDSDHYNDFYNSIITTKQKWGPREPWHDIHCRIEGPVTVDLLGNFKERWTKQGSKKSHRSLIEDDNLKNLVVNPDRWCAQMFRSINSDSAEFNTSLPSTGLSVKKERLFDNSIQRAYIHQIRRAKKFLYMENQYFMGSSHEWLECQDAGLTNLIPLEIAAHIEDKIMNGERFVAYILVPMFPEGKPADKVIQEMLHWQFRTIEMMYTRIANAIRNKGIDAHPQDFLMFFCLGKKEGHNPNPIPEELSGHAANAFKHRRLMIYVHSKMAIFDDEYIIVGSANINDRSLSGNRDTEIAIGSFQPDYIVYGDTLPDGDVSLFRKSLWVEHMGEMAPVYDDPSSLQCARRVRELAEEGFVSFIDQNDSVGIRHMLIYPLDVNIDGSVIPRYDSPTFPDTTASVTGKRSGYIPTSLTS